MNSGYVALIGRTNAGKSTFLNTILEAKVSIISNKPQTTRRQILGIKSSKKGQIIFFDSPGIHKPQFKLNERMMKDVHNSINDTDVLLYFRDVNDKRKDDFILELLHECKKPVFLILNKIDLYNKGKVLVLIDKFKEEYPWSEIVPISALKGLNLDVLEDLLYKYLPESEYFYDDEVLTTQSQKFYVAEMIREKILALTESELPFTTGVKVEEIVYKSKVVYIRADIFVESKSQKKILVGNKGSMVKNIGESARKDLEDYFEQKVYLDLFVKVVPSWRNSNVLLSEIFNS